VVDTFERLVEGIERRLYGGRHPLISIATARLYGARHPISIARSQWLRFERLVGWI